MDSVISLVKTYRLATGLAERLRLMDQIVAQIDAPLRLFVFPRIGPDDAEDAMQETLRALVAGLAKFQGETEREFWGWITAIARHKINDQFRGKAAQRVLPLSQKDIGRLLDASQQSRDMSAQDRADLSALVNALGKLKHECRDYLWNHYVQGFDYGEIAEAEGKSYDSIRMKIARCLETAQSLVN